MSVGLMAPPPAVRPRSADPTPREIIATARAAPAPPRGALILSALSGLLMWASFTPLDWSPLGWVALLPLLLLARLPRPSSRMYLSAYAGGLIFWVPALQWMRLGDPSMYLAWASLAIYLAFYYPAFLALTRLAVHRLGVPLALAAPVVWTTLEYARGHLLTGFGWYYLAHSQYRWITLIQLSDLLGAYGVSFVMVLAASAIAVLIPERWLAKLRLYSLVTEAQLEPVGAPPQRGARVSLVVGLLVVAATLGYGVWRRHTGEFRPGPRVAAVQGNFRSTLGGQGADAQEIYLKHRDLTGQAVRSQPDLILWPESMFRWSYFVKPRDLTDAQLKALLPELPIERWADPSVAQELTSLSQMAGAALVIGLETRTADADALRVYNSALFVTPKTGITARYDKMHRVPFGEFVPLAGWLPVSGPYRGELGLSAGQAGQAFDYQGVRYSPVICYEDTVPHVVRRALHDGAAGDGKPVDVLLNLSNDGWFQGSSELDQHLITAAFRCVEFRTPMVRAVNTGNSAIIDGDGVIRARAIDPRTQRSKSVDAVLIDTVPLDGRTSLYLRWGDWFSQVCAGLTLLASLAVLVVRRAA